MDIPIIGEAIPMLSIDCVACKNVMRIPVPTFEVLNGNRVSMVVWTRDDKPYKCNSCGKEYYGAIVGVHPQGIQAGMFSKEEPSGIITH